MNCPICNKKIKDDSKFCGRCGNKIPRCPTCGRVITKLGRFCQFDGTELPEEIVAIFQAKQDSVPVVEKENISMESVEREEADAVEAVTDEEEFEEQFVEEKRGKKKSIIPMIILIVFLLSAGIGYMAVNSGFSADEPNLSSELEDEEKEDKNAEQEETVEEEKEWEEVDMEEPSFVEAVPSVTMDKVKSAYASSVLVEGDYPHTAINVLDGDSSTAWIEGAAGHGFGETITLELEEKCLVSGFTIRSGFQKSSSLYEKNSRPSSVAVTFSDGSSETIAIDDINGTQTIYLASPKETKTVDITIKNVYPGSKYKDTAISELSLF